MLVSPISQPHLICGIHVGPWLYEISDRLLLPHLCREQQRPNSVLNKVFTWEERNANYHFHSYIECRLRYQVSYKSTGVKKMTMENEYVQLKRSPINQRHFMYDLRSLWLLTCYRSVKSENEPCICDVWEPGKRTWYSHFVSCSDPLPPSAILICNFDGFR